MTEKESFRIKVITLLGTIDYYWPGSEGDSLLKYYETTQEVVNGFNEEKDPSGYILDRFPEAMEKQWLGLLKNFLDKKGLHVYTIPLITKEELASGKTPVQFGLYVLRKFECKYIGFRTILIQT